MRIANNYRFGKHTETLKSIEGQLSFFNEAEAAYDESAPFVLVRKTGLPDALIRKPSRRMQEPPLPIIAALSLTLNV